MNADILTIDHPTAAASPETRRWSVVIAQFAAAQRGSGIDPETLRRRLRHVNQFAAYTELGIDEVTTSEFSRWVLSRQVSESTHGSMNDSGRAFYRWAFSSGIVRTNPLRESHRCAPSRAPGSWETHIQAWERHMRGLGRLPSTVTQRGRSVRKFARDNAPIEPWDVKMDHILDWFADNGWARETIRQRRSAIKDFYRWARHTNRTSRNPTKKLPVIPMQRTVPRPAQEDDVQRSIRLAGDRERLAIELAAGLGLRCAEVAGLHSSDLRERDGQWWLRVHGKGARERMLPVPNSLATALRALERGYVFPGQVNGHISPQYLSKRVNSSLPPGVTMHQLRHRFATVAYEKTRDTFVVQRLLGHSSPATTQAYVALSDPSLRSAVDAVADHR